MAGWSKLIKNVSYQVHIHLSGLAHCHILVAGLNSSLVTSLKRKKHTVKKEVTNNTLEPMEWNIIRHVEVKINYLQNSCVNSSKTVFSSWPCCIRALNWFGKLVRFNEININSSKFWGFLLCTKIRMLSCKQAELKETGMAAVDGFILYSRGIRVVKVFYN